MQVRHICQAKVFSEPSARNSHILQPSTLSKSVLRLEVRLLPPQLGILPGLGFGSFLEGGGGSGSLAFGIQAWGVGFCASGLRVGGIAPLELGILAVGWGVLGTPSASRNTIPYSVDSQEMLLSLGVR